MYNNAVYRSNKPPTKRYNTDQFDKPASSLSSNATRYNQPVPTSSLPGPNKIDQSKIDDLLWYMEKDG